MDAQIIFRERLTDLLDAAEETDGTLTKERIQEILKDMPLTDEHYQLIYEYLAEQNVRVIESEEEVKEEEGEGEEESRERLALSIYMDEISEFADVDEDEEAELFEKIHSGDESAAERLLDLYLPIICRMADDYDEEMVQAEDLIQEGNIGLLSAVRSLDDYDSTAACRAYLLNSIRGAMESAIKDGEELRKKDDGLVGRINHLNEAIHNLEEDLGHKVSVDEVSAYLEMPVEEIEDLLRVAGDQINMG